MRKQWTKVDPPKNYDPAKTWHVYRVHWDDGTWVDSWGRDAEEALDCAQINEAVVSFVSRAQKNLAR